jgi:hypothetical protein
MWIEMQKWVRKGGRLPNVPELVGELITPTYTFSNGQFVIEEKDQIKERLGRSPDLADALALTFAIPDMPGQAAELMGMPAPRAGHATTLDDVEGFGRPAHRRDRDFDPWG